MIIGRNQVMEKSNLTSRFDNHDYDGDSLIALAIHSEQAKADFKYAFVKESIEFEHMDELLIDYEHESIFSSYMLTLASSKNHIDNQITETLFDKIFSIDDFLSNINEIRMYSDFNDAKLTTVEAAINKSLLVEMYKEDRVFFENIDPIYIIERDGLLTKKNLTLLTENFYRLLNNFKTINPKSTLNFWDIIHEFDKFLLECSTSIEECNPSFKMEDFAVIDNDILKFKENLISVEPFVAFHQNLVLFEKVSNTIAKQPDNILNKVFKSGARLKSVQLLKAASNTGIPTDIYGKAFPANIKNSLLDGLTPKEYFITGDSARLALAVRQEAIPRGGELQRKFFFTIGILKLDKENEDCGTEKYYNITIKNRNHLKLLNHRWYLDADAGIEVLVDINDINLIGKTLPFRSPVTCKNQDYKICKKCFGEKTPESINLGSTVGAALAEGMIQSVLRTHHFGGAFIAHEDKQLIDILRNSDFIEPDTIICDEEGAKYIEEYLFNIYEEEDLIITRENLNSRIHLKLNVINLPFNDDAVKQLNNIVGLIDKNRDKSSMIEPSELYDKLELVLEQNNILSVYLELIISLLYYDENGILYRYTDKELHSQVALKNIIEVLDPKLGIFYNFSNRIISKIYNHRSIGHIDHMYHDLLGIYQ